MVISMAGRIENLKPWKPGQSGNPGGKPKGTLSLTNLIRKVLLEETGDGPDKTTRAMKVIRAAVEKAEEGDDRHLRMILDRIDGPVIQRIEADIQQNFKAIDKEAADDV